MFKIGDVVRFKTEEELGGFDSTLSSGANHFHRNNIGKRIVITDIRENNQLKIDIDIRSDYIFYSTRFVEYKIISLPDELFTF